MCLTSSLYPSHLWNRCTRKDGQQVEPKLQLGFIPTESLHCQQNPYTHKSKDVVRGGFPKVRHKVHRHYELPHKLNTRKRRGERG